MQFNPLRFSKILIVDDSKFFRTSIKKMLLEAQIGRRHYEAVDGKDAISKYVTYRPDVVIMDIMMPNVDGVKATQAITTHDPAAKIVVISAKENQETVNNAIRLGAKDYVFKPLDSSAVIMTVSKQLVLNRTYQQKQNLIITG